TINKDDLGFRCSALLVDYSAIDFKSESIECKAEQVAKASNGIDPRMRPHSLNLTKKRDRDIEDGTVGACDRRDPEAQRKLGECI
ncbi:hypothetical protein ALC57_07528, partial [Trachymyrmex cornetzi]